MVTSAPSLHSINKSLKWNIARVKTINELIRSFIKNRTINLTIASTTMGACTKATSKYRKAQRFFKDFDMPLSDIGRETFKRPKKGWKLSMDRPNWKFGKTHINILTIGVIINGIAIQLYLA